MNVLNSFNFKICIVGYLLILSSAVVLDTAVADPFNSYPGVYSWQGEIVSLNIESKKIVVNDKELRLSSFAEVHGPNNMKLNLTDLAIGMTVGCTKGSSNTITDLWLLDVRF